MNAWAGWTATATLNNVPRATAPTIRRILMDVLPLCSVNEARERRRTLSRRQSSRGDLNSLRAVHRNSALYCRAVQRVGQRPHGNSAPGLSTYERRRTYRTRRPITAVAAISRAD